MKLNLDVVIFLGFLLINLVIGLFYGRGVKTVREYAIGNRNFSTATISATLVATWVSGSDFFTYLSESYNNGLYFIWAATGDVFCLLLVALFFAPRLGEFLGKLSIAEAMGDLYGKKVRIITAIAGFIGTGGIIAVQFKVAGMLFQYALGLPIIYGVIISGAIITLYSGFGGIKSVTFTAIMQLFTFCTFIPVLALFILSNLDSFDLLINTVNNNPLFNYKEVFDFTNTKAFSYFFLFLFIAIPGFNPAIFQRIAIARNTKQVRQSFLLAAITCLFITFTMSWIGTLILSIRPNFTTNEIVEYIINGYFFHGFKGIILSCIMAMAMSTADSYINSTSVLFINDFCKPLSIPLVKKDLLLSSRLFSVFLGIFAVTLALSGESLLNLIIITNSFYLPIVTVPFIMATLGFRTTEKPVLIAMSAGLSTVLLWKTFLQNKVIDSVIPGMAANLLFLISSHYLLKQPGGFVGIKNQEPLIQARKERRRKFQKIILFFKEFNFIKFCKNNTPKTEYTYPYFGLFCIVSISTIYTLPIKHLYPQLLNSISISTFIFATIFISYPIWPKFFKKLPFIALWWNISLFYILICVGFTLAILSNFSQIPLMIFMLNIIMISILVRWQLALFMIGTGVIISIQFFKFYTGVSNLPDVSTEFKIIYILLLVSSVLLAFLKPVQEDRELAEILINLQKNQIYDREEEVIKALELKHEFLRNISHEVRTPMTGITTLSQILAENYNNFNEEEKFKTVKTIAESSDKLISLMNNILDLSKLSSLKYELNIEAIDFSELVYNRFEFIQKLYSKERNLEFINHIKPNLKVFGDEYYLTQTLDNLIINAIRYTTQGKITVTLEDNDQDVYFCITDEGVGIPKEELFDIFEPFRVSSKTKTPAGGRGVGLALCKKTVEIHTGKIWAENAINKGASFSFIIPKKPNLQSFLNSSPNSRDNFLNKVKNHTKKIIPA